MALGHPAYEQLRWVADHAGVVLANNPGDMTLDGTNTWLLRSGVDADVSIVVDPGPDDAGHLDAVVAAAGSVAEILLTHGHKDHSAGARALHERTGAPVRALDPEQRLGGEGLAEGDMIRAAGVTVRVWSTPGHTGDSLCFVLDDEAVLTGDTVLGRGTTVIDHPGGRLADYLSSLRRLSTLGPLTVLPGHGPELTSAAAAVRMYLAHRAERIAQVRRALTELGLDPVESSTDAVLLSVYSDALPAAVLADPEHKLHKAATASVKAQLVYLAGE